MKQSTIEWLISFINAAALAAAVVANFYYHGGRLVW